LPESALTDHEVARIFKRLAGRVGADLDSAGIAGHSTRIGAAHDLVEAGFDVAAIANAGGWTSLMMPNYYTRELRAKQSAMAQWIGRRKRRHREDARNALARACEYQRGVIFRRSIGRDEIGESLHPGSVASIFKSVAQWIGMPERFVAEVSGHSTRLGADADAAAVCGEDQCREVGNGESGKGKREGFDYRTREQVQIMGVAQANDRLVVAHQC
jgi:hypothetical protein